MLLPILRRVVITIVTIIAASTVVFLLIHASGDPVDGFLAPGASPEVRAAARNRIGLDDPLAEQYLRFVGNTLTGDFGDSWRNRMSALDAVLDRLPSTLRLASAAILLATVGGITIGLASVWINSPWMRSIVRLIGLLGLAVPAFWLGTLGILVFAVNLGWLPASGSDNLWTLVLPVFTLAAFPGSIIARMTQTSLTEVRTRPFIVTATAKGLPQRVVWLRHALPNALLPTLALIGLQAGFLVGGTIVVESVFAYPGVGRLALQAASERDLPVIHAFVVVTIILVAMINVAVDVIAVLIDPSLREQSQSAVSRG